MPTLEQETEMRETRATAAAERFFSRPLYRSPAFVMLSVAGVLVVVFGIRLSIMAYSRSHVMYTESTLFIVAFWSACAWFRAADSLEDMRAFYLNETNVQSRDKGPLAIALMSGVNTILNGLFFTYMIALMLLSVISRAFHIMPR
jgi:hypothetical protein